MDEWFPGHGGNLRYDLNPPAPKVLRRCVGSGRLEDQLLDKQLKLGFSLGSGHFCSRMLCFEVFQSRKFLTSCVMQLEGDCITGRLVQPKQTD